MFSAFLAHSLRGTQCHVPPAAILAWRFAGLHSGARASTALAPGARTISAAGTSTGRSIAAASSSTGHQQHQQSGQQHQQQHHRQHRGGRSGSSWGSGSGAAGWGAAAAAAAAALAAAALAPAAAAAAKAEKLSSDGVEAANNKLLSLETRRRIFFKYEKRIRDMSSLEKTYEYFATQVDSTGAKAMDVRDVVRAVVPTYPASDTTVERAGFLDGERGARVQGGLSKEPRNSVFRVLDDDGDGVISFNEFRLVVLLLSIPEADIKVVFNVVDMDDSGYITADEFDQVFTELERRAGLQRNFHARAGKHDNTAGASDVGVGNTARALFGRNRRGTMDLKRFQGFLTQLHADVTRLEFSHYDSNGDGYIRGLDFGNSIAGAADIKYVDKYLDRVAAMEPRLQDARISFSEFQSLSTVRRHLHRLTFAIEFCGRIGRPVDKADFVKLTQRLVGVKLTPNVVDILFVVCGDGGGNLDGHAFVKLMRAREKMPGRKGNHFQSRGELGPVGRLFTCFKDCVTDPDEPVDQPEQ